MGYSMFKYEQMMVGLFIFPKRYHMDFLSDAAREKSG